MLLLEITSEGFLFIYIISGIITLFLLGITISTAIRVNRRDRHNKIIIELLSAIAEKNGVEREFLDELGAKSKI